MRLARHKVAIFLLLAGELLHATSITTLLEALNDRSENRLDTILVQQSHIKHRAIAAKLMPSANLFGNYEIYSAPTGMLPIPPNTLTSMVKDPHAAQPFSKEILRGGASFTWPLFIKSLYTLKEKTYDLQLAAQDKKRLNLLQREALVVGSVAQMHYLKGLKKALLSKKTSIKQTEKTLRLKVKNGRAAESGLLVLQGKIDKLDISLNTLAQQLNTLRTKIETLTGIYPTESVLLQSNKTLQKGSIFALRPLQRKVEAMQKGIKAAHESYYPSLMMKGRYTYSTAEAYNNDADTYEHYGQAGVYLSMPLFDASKNRALEQAKLAWIQEKTKKEQTQHTLEVKAKQLEREISLLEHSITLAKQSVRDQKQLRHIAKVSFDNARITREEYLRYEDALASAKAERYGFEAKRWQDIAQLAVIYGNDLKEIVK